MTQHAPASTQRGLTALNLQDTRRLRILREGPPNTVWAYGMRRNIFFVTGHARSGTTWAASILMRHPLIFADGEYHFHQLRRGFDLFQAQPHHRATREPVHSTAEECFQDTIRLSIAAAAHQRPGALWVGDRTPRPLEVLLPGTPHFVIIRDGRDVTVSLSIMEIHQGGGLFSQCRDDPKLVTAREHFLKDPEFFKNNPHELLVSERLVRTIAGRWARQAAHDVQTVNRIHAGEIDATARIVFYEHLHTDPEGERLAMYEMLGVDPAAAEPLTAESGTKPGLQTDNHTSDKRKGIVGDWMNYFTDEAKGWFKDEAGEVMLELNYESDDRW